MSLNNQALRQLIKERPEDVEKIAEEVTTLLGVDTVLTQSLDIMSFTKRLHLIALTAIKRRLEAAGSGVSDPDIGFKVLREAHRAFTEQGAGFSVEDLQKAAGTMLVDYFDVLATANMFQIAAPKEVEEVWEKLKQAASEQGLTLEPTQPKSSKRAKPNRQQRRAQASNSRKKKKP